MKIILIRHSESQKNIASTFATVQNEEPLTKHGEDIALFAGQEILKYVETQRLQCKNIYVANSLRAIMTGKIISHVLGDVSVTPVDEFISLKNDVSLGGLSEEEVDKVNGQFIQELSLSRAGILNGYRFSSNWTKDIVCTHEIMAYKKYLDILFLNKNEDLVIMVMHHSSITAVLINIARQYYGYPKDFFGNIECDLCNIFLIEYQGEKADIKLANVSADKLLKRF